LSQSDKSLQLSLYSVRWRGQKPEAITLFQLHVLCHVRPVSRSSGPVQFSSVINNYLSLSASAAATTSTQRRRCVPPPRTYCSSFFNMITPNGYRLIQLQRGSSGTGLYIQAILHY